MCYNLSVTSSPEELEECFDAEYINEEGDVTVYYHVSGFSHPLIPVITAENKKKIQRFSWGLVPKWVKDEAQASELQKMTLNAKSETVFEKPAFKSSIIEKRCLVLVNGFYEWKQAMKAKYPHFIFLKDAKPFSMGGIYSDWVNKSTGEIHRTFSILTTEANPLMAKIHNTKKRMPLIIPRYHEHRWLDDGISVRDIKEMMVPFDDHLMGAYTVSKIVSRKDIDNNVPEALSWHKYSELETNRYELF